MLVDSKKTFIPEQFTVFIIWLRKRGISVQKIHFHEPFLWIKDVEGFLLRQLFGRKKKANKAMQTRIRNFVSRLKSIMDFQGTIIFVARVWVWRVESDLCINKKRSFLFSIDNLSSVLKNFLPTDQPVKLENSYSIIRVDRRMRFVLAFLISSDDLKSKVWMLLRKVIFDEYVPKNKGLLVLFSIQLFYLYFCCTRRMKNSIFWAIGGFISVWVGNPNFWLKI